MLAYGRCVFFLLGRCVRLGFVAGTTRHQVVEAGGSRRLGVKIYYGVSKRSALRGMGGRCLPRTVAQSKTCDKAKLLLSHMIWKRAR